MQWQAAAALHWRVIFFRRIAKTATNKEARHHNYDLVKNETDFIDVSSYVYSPCLANFDCNKLFAPPTCPIMQSRLDPNIFASIFFYVA
jgi:hypothetical protein